MDAKSLKNLGLDLFSKKLPLNNLWQEISENFYPERADFTVLRTLSDEFASNLMTSYPILVRRDLGNQLTTMLRPTAKQWFHPGIKHKEKKGHDTKQFLEWTEKVQRRAMYDKGAKFSRATKEGDHDFAAFGQCAISVEMNRNANGLLYRCWHLRDMAWQENEEGDIGAVFRKWNPTLQTLDRTFHGKLDPKIAEKLDKTPFELAHVMHMVVDADMYSEKAGDKPRWSIWYDLDNDVLIEAVPIYGKHYVIPRFQTVSGSQYAYSPATVAALPDARLIQAMTYSLLEAGEKATNPPIVATQGAVKSDVAIYAGGITWVDQEYDEKLGAALKPIPQDLRGMNTGFEMTRDTRALLEKCFFLDTLRMPMDGREMTAYETAKRVEQYIRNALPIFEPMEEDYNGNICDESFELLWRNGAYGDPRNWPDELHGAEIEFSFESPLHDAIDEQKGMKFQQANALLGEAMAMDPRLGALPKAEVALRDALEGIGVPSTWINSEQEYEDKVAEMEQVQQQQAQLAAMEQASKVAKNMGDASGGGMI